MKKKFNILFYLKNSYNYDFYENILNFFDKDSFAFILEKREDELSFHELKKYLDEKKISFYDTKNYKEKLLKSKIIITQLESTFFFLKFLGFKLFFKKKNFLHKIVNKFKIKYYPIERDMGEKIVFFPKGMDLKLGYPAQFKICKSDIFLCHSKVDEKIIKNKTNKPSYIIGYPRYDSSFLQKKITDNTKKKILIMHSPTTITRSTSLHNLENLLLKFQNYFDKFEFYFKPHPRHKKYISFPSKNIKNKIKIVEDNENLNNLYKNIDLVFCQNGGPFFSSIFNLKNVFIFEETKDSFHEEIKNIYDEYKNFYLLKNYKIEDLLTDNLQSNILYEQKKVTKDLKNIFFPNFIDNSSKYTANILKNILKSE